MWHGSCTNGQFGPFPTLTALCDGADMFHRTLDVLDDYEVIGQPVVGPRGLSYVPWIDRAIAPYRATRLPNCTVVGLWDALRRAEHLT